MVAGCLFTPPVFILNDRKTVQWLLILFASLMVCKSLAISSDNFVFAQTMPMYFVASLLQVKLRKSLFDNTLCQF